MINLFFPRVFSGGDSDGTDSKWRERRFFEWAYHKSFLNFFYYLSIIGVWLRESRLKVVGDMRSVWLNFYTWMKTILQSIGKKICELSVGVV